jgi:hypothetical protein
LCKRGERSSGWQKDNQGRDPAGLLARTFHNNNTGKVKKTGRGSSRILPFMKSLGDGRRKPPDPIALETEDVRKFDFPFRHLSGPRGWADWRNIRAEPTHKIYKLPLILVTKKVAHKICDPHPKGRQSAHPCGPRHRFPIPLKDTHSFNGKWVVVRERSFAFPSGIYRYTVLEDNRQPIPSTPTDNGYRQREDRGHSTQLQVSGHTAQVFL